MSEKIAPYLIPIFDIIQDNISVEQYKRYIVSEKIKTIPLAFLRGVSFKNVFVFADEMQNTTPEQMRLLLTRVGKNCKLVVAGDLRQSDIRGVNGLMDGIKRLEGVTSLGIVQLTEKSILRSPIVAEIENRYHKDE